MSVFMDVSVTFSPLVKLKKNKVVFLDGSSEVFYSAKFSAYTSYYHLPLTSVPDLAVGRYILGKCSY